MSEVRRLLRAYPTLLRVGLANGIAYRAEFIVWMLTSTMPLIMLALWTSVARSGPIGGFGRADFIAYYLLTLLVRQLTGTWVVWELNMEIRQGLLPFRLMRPIHPLLAMSAEGLALIPLRGLLAVPVLCILLGTAGRASLTLDPVQLALFVTALAGAWGLQFLFLATIGTLALYIESALGVFQIIYTFFMLLSGYTVPIELFPPWLATVARALPFRYMQGLPVEILTGRLSRAQALADLGRLALYTFAFYFLCTAIWRAGIRRYQAYGG